MERSSFDSQAVLKFNAGERHPGSEERQDPFNFLLTTQNADGGWSFPKSKDSDVYVTALVSVTLQELAKLPRNLFARLQLAEAIRKSVGFLISRQNGDGGFGPSPSSPHETALACVALAEARVDPSVLSAAAGYLHSTQLANGSWRDEPYLTALASQALSRIVRDGTEREAASGWFAAGLSAAVLPSPVKTDGNESPDLGYLDAPYIRMGEGLSGAADQGEGRTPYREGKVSIVARRKSGYLSQSDGEMGFLAETPDRGLFVDGGANDERNEDVTFAGRVPGKTGEEQDTTVDNLSGPNTDFQSEPDTDASGPNDGAAGDGGDLHRTTTTTVAKEKKELASLRPKTAATRDGIVMTAFGQWPSGFYKSILAFSGGVFDGKNVWMIPANAQSVVRVDGRTGAMTAYNRWPEGFKKGSRAFSGGVFDGKNVWMIPANAQSVIRLDPETGTMTVYDDWPSGFKKGGHAFAGGVFDGRNIWLVPSYAQNVIRLDPETGTMTVYDDWPSGFKKGGHAFSGGVFDGKNVWMIPANAQSVIRLDLEDGSMRAYQDWPSGFSKGEYAFAGGVFDGKNIWMIPYYSDRVVVMEIGAGGMEGVDRRPPEIDKGEYAFSGGVFDGESIWMIPLNADGLVRISKTTKEITRYHQWPAGFTKGVNAFAGGVFDGKNIWMIPSDSEKIISSQPAPIDAGSVGEHLCEKETDGDEPFCEIVAPTVTIGAEPVVVASSPATPIGKHISEDARAEAEDSSVIVQPNPVYRGLTALVTYDIVDVRPDCIDAITQVIIPLGKPPALPGDSQSLTFSGL